MFSFLFDGLGAIFDEIIALLGFLLDTALGGLSAFCSLVTAPWKSLFSFLQSGDGCFSTIPPWFFFLWGGAAVLFVLLLCALFILFLRFRMKRP